MKPVSQPTAIPFWRGTGPTLRRWRAAGADASVPALRRIMLICVSSSRDRAMMLRAGIGDALPSEVSLAEIALRAERIAQMWFSVPGYRALGEVTLNLMARDGSVQGATWGCTRASSLCSGGWPMRPGTVFDKRALVRDVWRMNHVPETNSIAVHISVCGPSWHSRESKVCRNHAGRRIQACAGRRWASWPDRTGLHACRAIRPRQRHRGGRSDLRRAELP